MRAHDVFHQNDGEVTKQYYADLCKLGPLGEIAVALFRAQKRSSRAKDYRRGRFRRAAYDVKSWSMQQLCGLLALHGGEFRWGWKEDPDVLFGQDASFVLYVDLPQGFGQVSFHSPSRMDGPEYVGEWDGHKGMSEERIIAFCDWVENGVWATPVKLSVPEIQEQYNQHLSVMIETQMSLLELRTSDE